MSITREIKLKTTKVMLFAGLVLFAFSSFAKDVAKDPKLDLQQRLKDLSKTLEKNRKDLRIPGMAIAIVKDNEVIMAKGFGLSDLEKNIGVTPETIFAIGSSTKAFTATLVGMQVDDKKMEWDAPITDYIPTLKYSLENKDDQVTIRDMLSHRSGYARNDILWINGKVDREAILKTSVKAEPYSDYHEKFNYNNVMFLGAGEASAKHSNTDWDTLLEERLLKPLGMDSSSSRLEITKQNPKLSQGYIWLDQAKEFQYQTMKDLKNIAPAGAINSNVLDMAKWLKFQLNDGIVDGKRLISAASLKETHTAQISLAKSIDYGMGWFLREWNGQPVVEHGGNIAGFGAQVAFLPESNLGFVLLTNVTATPLQQASMNIVWEALLGNDKAEENVVKGDSATNSHEQYFGDYIANFGPFKDAIFAVTDKDGKLHVNVPGQMNYTLKEPNDKGLWVFAMTDTISVSFDKDAAGQVTAMRMQQGGMNFEIPRKGLVIQPEIDPVELQAYLGTYESSVFKGNIQAIIQNHRLAIDVPNQMIFELHLPDAKQQRQFRIKSDMKAVFVLDDAEQVSAVEIYSGDKLIDTAKRIATELEKLPTLDEILELRNTKKQEIAFEKAGDIQMTGTVNFVNSGIVGDFISQSKGNDSLLVNMDLGDFGYLRTAFNADTGSTDGIQQYRSLKGTYLLQAQKDHFAAGVDWRDFYESIKIVGAEIFNDKKVYVVMLKTETLPTVTLYLDAESGDVVKRKSNQLAPVVGQIPMTFIFEDYRDVNGLRMPFRTIVENPFAGKIIMQFDSLETSLNFPAELFIVNNPEKGE